MGQKYYNLNDDSHEYGSQKDDSQNDGCQNTTRPKEMIKENVNISLCNDMNNTSCCQSFTRFRNLHNLVIQYASLGLFEVNFVEYIVLIQS